MQVNESFPGEARSELRHFLWAAVVGLWRMVTLPVFVLLLIGEPVVRVVMTTIALLGVLISVVLETSGVARHFPFVAAMAFFVGCGAVPLLYRACLRITAP